MRLSDSLVVQTVLKEKYSIPWCKQMENDFLNRVLGCVSFLETLIDQKITYIGIFDEFAAIECTNAFIFLVPKEKAPKPIDKKHYFAFNALPAEIQSYGIDCSGYFIKSEEHDIVILLAPRAKCEGNIRIKRVRRERIGAVDAIFSSLLSLFDSPSGYITYKEKVLGVLSFAKISPLADLALKKLKNLTKAGARFIKRDEKTIETGWLKRISFGVRPILFNKITIDFDSLERKLALMKIKFDKEILRAKVLFRDYKPLIYERIIEYIHTGEKIIAKTTIIKGKIVDKQFLILLARLMENFEAMACIGEDIFNIALALCSQAKGLCVGGKDYEREKLKIEKIDYIDDPRYAIIPLYISLIASIVNMSKFKIGKISGIAIQGKRDDLNIVGLIY